MAKPLLSCMLLLGAVTVAIACGSDESSSSGSSGGSSGAGGSAAGAGGSSAGAGGSAGSSGTGGGAGSGGASVCGPAVCGSGTACGAVVDDCGETVQCDLCRYSGEDVASAFPQAISLAVGAAVQIAYAPDAMLATRGSMPWATESFGMASPEWVDLAQASDGTPWIAYVDDSALWAARRSGATWTTDQLAPAATIDAAIAIADDGTVYVATWGNGGGVATDIGIHLHQFDGSSWSSELVAETTGGRVDLAVDGNQVHLAWWDAPAEKIFWARSTSGGFEIEEVGDATGSGSTISVAIAVDEGGTPHVAFTEQVVGGDPAYYAVREAGSWNVTAIGSGVQNGDEAIRIATDGSGGVTIGYIGRNGIVIAQKSSSAWLSQIVNRDCDNDSDPFDISYDSAGTLYVAFACSAGFRLLEQTGKYPSGYAETCAAVGSALCDRGCDCGDDMGQCCMKSASGTGSCSGPRSHCKTSIAARICGDATQDPALVDACQADIPGAACATPEPGMVLPDSCAVFWQ